MTPIQPVLDVLSYVRQFSGTTVVIKIGGRALQNEKLLQEICEDLIAIRAVGISVVLVHGGRSEINDELTKQGMKYEFIDGQRVTTAPMVEVIESVLSGKINRRIVRTLGHAGVRAVGFSGVDGRTLMCKPGDAKLGRVGVIEKVNLSLIQAVLDLQSDEGLRAIPVIAPLALGLDGLVYNMNSDWAASRIAQALGVTKMLFLTSDDGIVDNSGRLIPELDAAELENLVEAGEVSGGMLTKARTIAEALRSCVTDVHVFNANRPHGLIEELFTEKGIGTVCRLRSRTRFTTEGLV